MTSCFQRQYAASMRARRDGFAPLVNVDQLIGLDDGFISEASGRVVRSLEPPIRQPSPVLTAAMFDEQERARQTRKARVKALLSGRISLADALRGGGGEAMPARRSEARG